MAAVMAQVLTRLHPYTKVGSSFLEAVELRFIEYLQRPRYDDVGYVWHRLGQLALERNHYACGASRKQPR